MDNDLNYLRDKVELNHITRLGLQNRWNKCKAIVRSDCDLPCRGVDRGQKCQSNHSRGRVMHLVSMIESEVLKLMKE
jgi:hypothetical protein